MYEYTAIKLAAHSSAENGVILGFLALLFFNTLFSIVASLLIVVEVNYDTHSLNRIRLSITVLFSSSP